MEDSAIISNFCKSLASFCTHLHDSTNALKESVERRPIPLDSSSSTFLQCLNRRVSSASSDLNLLESMTCETVSFEELLGHCNQLYQKNQSDLRELEDHWKNYGYDPPEVDVDDDNEVLGLTTPARLVVEDRMNLHSWYRVPPSAARGSMSVIKKFEDDHLFDESLSLQNLGLSDLCLATLASEPTDEIDYVTPSRKPLYYNDGQLLRSGAPYPSTTKGLDTRLGDLANDPELVVDAKQIIKISRDEYEDLPSFMKSLASWEDMVAAVEKLNSNLNRQDKSKESNLFYQEDLSSLGLGVKVRSYLLMLIRMNRLVIETVNGSIAYRVL